MFVNPRLKNHLEIQMTSGTGCMGEDQLSDSQKRRLRKELDRVKPFRKLNRLLELGPGKGWFLREATLLGWETWAVEVNSVALKHLSFLKPDRIIAKPAEEFCAPENSMDVVRVWDVIEHLRSPRQAMTNVYKSLRPGGLLLLATTNFASLSRWINGPDWVYLNGADHIFLFEPRSMTSLLTKLGFSNIRIQTRSFNMRRKLYHPERELPIPFSIIRPFRKLIDECIKLTPYGHQMIVSAIK